MGQLETAKIIWDYLISQGWSKSAVAGLLGNMQSESGIIADRWESDIVGNMSGGYGLVQWTPATKYIDWANANGLDYTDVISQCKRIEWEVSNNQQFYNIAMTFQQFKTSSKSPEDLAYIFLQYYERPANSDQPVRAQQARYWYQQLNRGKVVDWYNNHRGQITYSMYGSRNGTDGTADCSGSVTQAVRDSCGIPYSYLYSTVTLGGYLQKCGYERVLVGNTSGSNLDQLKDEDIVLLSCGSSMADSGGAGGHTGVITGGGKNLTSTCYYTKGEVNTAIQELRFDANYLAADGFKYYEVWRFAGSFNQSNTSGVSGGDTSPSFSTNVHYCLRVLGGSWLNEITNFNHTDSNGFSGLPNNKHDMLYIKVDKGTLRYRAHTIESGWLNWISKGDPNDLVNGCAGNPGETIDGVQIYYTTPSGENFSQAYYRSQTTARSEWLQTCCDDGTSIAGYDGWAGMYGEPLDRLQIGIATSNPLFSYSPGVNNGGNFSTNVRYCLRLLDGSWLNEITNFNDTDSYGFSGLPRNRHDMLYIKVDSGTLRYRVHTMESGWLNWISKGDPNDFVSGCAGNPGETIDGVQIYYTTPEGKPLSQAYYRSQTADRAGWLNVCCDDGTSIAGYDGWAGMYGEPLDRLQIGIGTSNQFYDYGTDNNINNMGGASPGNEGIGGSTANAGLGTTEVDMDALTNTLVHDIIDSVASLSPIANTNITFETNKTYGPISGVGIDFWVTTGVSISKIEDKRMLFTIKNGKLTTNFQETFEGIFHGFSGTLDYIDAARAIDKVAGKIQNGTVIFSAAYRKEELDQLGLKMTFEYKTVRGDETVKTAISFEIYFKKGGLSPDPIIPISTYDALYVNNQAREVYMALGVAILVIGGAAAIFYLLPGIAAAAGGALLAF